MSRTEKFILKLPQAKTDNNIDFYELRSFLKRLGFYERIKGSHHILDKDGVEEIINIQPKGKLAKAYQVKQVRKLIIDHKMTEENIEKI